MKITLEFGNTKEFLHSKELLPFAQVIDFAGRFVHFDQGVPVADIPEATMIDGKRAYKKADAEKINKAIEEATAPATPVKEEAPQEAQEEAPKEEAASSPAEEEKPQEEAPAKSETDDSYSLADIRKVLNAAIKADHRKEMKALLKEFGATNVTTLPKEKYAEFVARTKQIGGADA